MAYQFGEIVFDKYQIEKQIGEGTYGEVYLVTHLKLDIKRVVKLIRYEAETKNDPIYKEIRNRFQQEAQIGSRLNHPALIRVFDFDESENLMAIAMEYASGGSLLTRNADRKIGGGPAANVGLDIPETIQIAAQIAEGLAVIHALDIVHRDLKPSNILFDENGRIKIADLGLAQIKDGKSQRSHSESLPGKNSHPGTPAYMSPEQESSFKYLTTASDVYSFGLILFEMLSGRLYKNLRPGTRIHDLRPDTPQWLDDLLANALSDNPEQRPWSGEELVKIFADHNSNIQNPVPQPISFKPVINNPVNLKSTAVDPVSPTKLEISSIRVPEEVRIVKNTANDSSLKLNPVDFQDFFRKYRLYLIGGTLVIGVVLVILFLANNFGSSTAAPINSSNPSRPLAATSIPAKGKGTLNTAENPKPDRTLVGKWSVDRVVGFPPKSRPWQDVGNSMEFDSTGIMKMTTYDGVAGSDTTYKSDGNKVVFTFEDGHQDTWRITYYEFKDTIQLNKDGTEEIMELSRIK